MADALRGIARSNLAVTSLAAGTLDQRVVTVIQCTVICVTVRVAAAGIADRLRAVPSYAVQGWPTVKVAVAVGGHRRGLLTEAYRGVAVAAYAIGANGAPIAERVDEAVHDASVVGLTAGSRDPVAGCQLSGASSCLGGSPDETDDD
jgi:hypothetical protein